MPGIEDSYEIQKELGRYALIAPRAAPSWPDPLSGEFSVVHLGVHKKTGEKFAIKVIEKNEMDTSRLETEVNILKKVQHPNIIHLKEFFDTPKKLYLVMELYVHARLLCILLALNAGPVSPVASCSTRSSSLAHIPKRLQPPSRAMSLALSTISIRTASCIVI